jgi:hypothetical protein
MFANARTYNVEGSQIYEDAVALEKLLMDALPGLCDSHNVDYRILTGDIIMTD